VSSATEPPRRNRRKVGVGLVHDTGNALGIWSCHRQPSSGAYLWTSRELGSDLEIVGDGRERRHSWVNTSVTAAGFSAK
jgi:hypothetical protein